MAMQINADVIVSQMALMSPEDILKIHKCAGMLITNTGAELEQETTPSDEDERMLFDALRGEMKAAGIRAAISFTDFQQTRHYRSWRKGVNVTKEFVANSFEKYARRHNEKNALYKVLMQVLAQDLKRRELPLTTATIASNLQYIHAAFERQFPGYLSAGIAYLVPKAMLRRR